MNAKSSLFSVSCLVVMATILPLAGCANSAGVQGSQTTCNQFLQQMQAGNAAGAYALLTTACKGAVTQQQLQNYWDLVEKNRGKIQGWTQTGYMSRYGTGGSSVQLNYSLQCASGASGAAFNCVEENGAWLIQGVNFAG